MLKKCAFFLVALLGLLSCSQEGVPHKAILEKDLHVSIHRFEKDFSEDSGKSLEDLKNRYPFFFPLQTPDSIWNAKRIDSIEKLLYRAVDSVFPQLNELQGEINNLFKYRDYYFPNTPLPKVYTLTTDVDYENKIIYTDSLLLIGLDNYLGTTHSFYEAFPEYIRQSLKSENITSDIARALAEPYFMIDKDHFFLSEMIREGKIGYLKSLLIPELSLRDNLQYTEDQMVWAQQNEAQIWRYFIERDYLYSTDKELPYRFLHPAPFSKFQLEIDSESPGRIGRFIGYQIVSAYMKQSGSQLSDLETISSVELLKKSNYKPKK